jgi:hypothetical protein
MESLWFRPQAEAATRLRKSISGRALTTLKVWSVIFERSSLGANEGLNVGKGDNHCQNLFNHNKLQLCIGGGRGIRTPDTLSGTAVFKTAAINHSAIPPRDARDRRTAARLPDSIIAPAR